MSNPRIIAGKAKGLRLKSVPGDSTRPVTDQVKESVFNIIGQDIEGTNFLDLFGGTGSIGIEALSRGAKFVQFVDINHSAIATIKSNLEHTRLKESAGVTLGDAFAYLRKPGPLSFDYIYIAPPQYKELWQRALSELDDHIGWLNPDAWVIVQIHPVEYKQIELMNLHEFEQRRYGSTLLIFFGTKVED